MFFLSKDDTTLKEIKKNEWGIYNREDKFLGTLKRKDRVLHLYNTNGNYLGSILSNNEFRPMDVVIKTKERKVPKIIEVLDAATGNMIKKTIYENKYSKNINPAKITPEAIKLYVQTLKAIDQIK